MLIEYQVREIKRFIVTRFETSGPDDDGRGKSGVSEIGEYSNPDMAYEVGYAVCKAEHARLGFPIDDDRIHYPQRPGEVACIKPA